MKGGTVCRMHGGMTPAVREKARERQLEAALKTKLSGVDIEPVTDPIAYYAQLAGEIWAWKELCREKVNQLTAWEHTAALTGSLDLRPTIAIYERAQDRAEKQLHNMIRLGLDAQALKHAKNRPTEEMAASILAIIETVVASLDLTPEQQQKVQPAFITAFAKEAQQ